MNRVVALLAAVLASAGLTACGGDGAEPGALRGATLVLDFQPNAVHAGIYAALREGYYRDAGLDLDVREPSASTDAPKLLEAGRAQLAILDIHDLGLARERNLELVGVMPIVQRPLASVIAADREAVRRPRDLEGQTVGVTGLPSDDAVLDSVLESDGSRPDSIRRVTIGFQAVSSLAAGKVAAATAFWNAEGVTLRRQGVPIRVFRVDDFGAPRYPELVLVTTDETLNEDRGLVQRVVGATRRGYALATRDPARALRHLEAADPSLEGRGQAAELRALEGVHAFEPVGRFDRRALDAWAGWEVERGILERRPAVADAFWSPAGSSSRADR
jgi:NitT/TauT family transport system substrate-binding protein/putative hydroxymethylpyrimidine transport system substrate-binding protein